VSRPVRLADAVDIDLAAGFHWYNEQVPKLGVVFLQQVEEALNRIAEFPDSYQIQFADFHGAPVRRFPYTVFYRLRPEIVEVDAILNNRIDPLRARARLAALSNLDDPDV
jgi:hypothetical protein